MTLPTQDQSEAAELRIRQHRARLLMQHPWYGSIGCELELQIDPTCDTAWTNGKAIGFNPDFAMSLPTKQLSGVVAHEILHVAMRHNYRRGNRDHGMWNEACDYAINGVLIADGFELPADALLEDRFKSMSSEQVYAALLAERQQQEQDQEEQQGDGDQAGDEQSDETADNAGGEGEGEGQQGGESKGEGEGQEAGGEGQGTEANGGDSTSQGQGSYTPGEVRDAPADAPAEDDWKTKIVQAAKLAQNLAGSAGAADAAMDRAVEDARDPMVNWKDVLQQFLTQTVREDFDWSRPSRRHLHTDIHMPSMSSDGAGTIAVAIDTSGSIDTKALETFMGELQGVVDQINPERVLVWCCDTRVRGGCQTFERGDLIAPEIVGGGGTRFEPAFEAAEKSDEDIACLIYFTDGCATMPRVTPNIPTLWAITGGEQRHRSNCKTGYWAEMPTFGEVTYLEAN